MKWESIKMSSALAERVPADSGVYAISEVNRIHGMPFISGVIYVGKSNNLKRRFKEHNDPWREHNEVLNDKTMSGELEFWFLKISIKKMDTLEKQLINEMSPLTNKIRYRGYKNV